MDRKFDLEKFIRLINAEHGIGPETKQFINQTVLSWNIDDQRQRAVEAQANRYVFTGWERIVDEYVASSQLQAEDEQLLRELVQALPDDITDWYTLSDQVRGLIDTTQPRYFDQYYQVGNAAYLKSEENQAFIRERHKLELLSGLFTYLCTRLDYLAHKNPMHGLASFYHSNSHARVEVE